MSLPRNLWSQPRNAFAWQGYRKNKATGKKRHSPGRQPPPSASPGLLTLHGF
jgi:hypothetical protein